MADPDDAPAALTFAADIKPLFRDFDRNSMIKAFDLWKHSDVVAHQDPILLQLEGGTMPCDGAWSAEHVETFRRWIAEGSRP